MSSDPSPSSGSVMPKAYVPADCESRWYTFWEKNGYFQGDPQPGQEPYCIVIPPPNVTGMLHLGHVLNNTLQDILIRFEKMRGKNVCWVPGTDHAGIATQAKVEAHLKETENVTRQELGRDAFLERVWAWKEEYGGTIIRQLRRLGCACDWRRERFTLDAQLSEAVQDIFIRLYEKGLIYKGSRMINWCPKSQTALSDEEVIHKSVNGKLWTFRYPFVDGDGAVEVATTRPETMLGDTAVAVHPNDARYTDLVGRHVHLPLTGRTIPVVADDFVDPEFGTGAVKVTPGHDPNDYAIGLRHDLEVRDIMNDDGTMNDLAGADFAGMDRYACRDAVIERLQGEGALVGIEEHPHQVGYSERGNVPIEPKVSEQWFCSMSTLAEPAIAAVREGRIRFTPKHWTKTYFNWMENLQDWCISRQLWWGHRIPAYYCQGCGEITVGRAAPETCGKCSGTEFRQDEDVLDTWFSSWLWPFSVFDWPKKSDDLSHFYPTQTLVTGPDIIFFWVARMIMAGYEFMGEAPFRDVYFTSIIRDDIGRKMSKQLGNSPDPIEVMDEYGADALRYTMIYLAPVGLDIRYSPEKCEIGRNFANKVWNAARFRQMHGPVSPDWDGLDNLAADALRPDDRWILAQADAGIRTATSALESFDFHSYAHQLYEFVWNTFCDWYVESTKAVLHGDDTAAKQDTLQVFDFAFSQILRLLHPVIPVVTEEISHALGFTADDASIMTASWPVPLSADESTRLGLEPEFIDLVDEKFSIIRAGRNLRSTYRISDSKKVPFYIKPTHAPFADLLSSDIDSVRRLLNAESVDINADYQADGSVPGNAGKYGSIYLPIGDLIDIAAETKRLTRQIADVDTQLGKINGKLNNEKFLARAPEDVIARERLRLEELSAQKAQLQKILTSLG